MTRFRVQLLLAKRCAALAGSRCRRPPPARGFFQGLFGSGQPAAPPAAPLPLVPPGELPFPVDMLSDTPLSSARPPRPAPSRAPASVRRPTALLRRQTASWRSPTEPHRTAGARWSSTAGAARAARPQPAVPFPARPARRMTARRCDFKGPCVVLARTEGGAVFGGFNPCGFMSTDDYASSWTAFLFCFPGGARTPTVLRKARRSPAGARGRAGRLPLSVDSPPSKHTSFPGLRPC